MREFSSFVAGVVCGVTAAFLALVAVENAVARGTHLPPAGGR